MQAKEIRSSFLNYFKKNGHTIVESSSLVPSNDPTLLFTNAGMVQFKDVFLGKEKRPYTRATTSQKCVRAGGKHNDLENVGYTARHHTFFEMLGNFSFGDYFKKDAIHFAWEFVTRELQLPKDRLYVSVFKDDDEAAEIWNRQEKVDSNRIFRFGEKDNFWSMGDTGPCGPCSELFIDRGEKYGCGKKTCNVGCDCDRYIEFWNLVFMQFERDASGKLSPLPKPSVDTGAGLERIASILQKADSNYETDLFEEIIQKTTQLSGVKGSREISADLRTSLRVIADHSRATAFLIGDGVLPSNEGRGYVLRRIMRRAIRHGSKLGFKDPFLAKTAGFVIDQMKSAYPDLESKRPLIQRAVQAEEEQFLRTLDRGLALLEEATQKLKKGATLDGATAFKLYDTYGFPVDLTRVICSEKGFQVDEAGFEKNMDHQREESRKHWKGSGEAAVDKVYFDISERLQKQKLQSEFVGYDQLQTQSKCLAVIPHAQKTKIQAVFHPCPFYPEGGGQVADRGEVRGKDFSGVVVDVQKPVNDLIVVTIEIKEGNLKEGSTYELITEKHLRSLIARNHTATHLLHWALRSVLGNHVKQAGSLVSADLLRFDFNHFEPVTENELEKIESMINEKIWKNFEVKKNLMPKDRAIDAGAIAFFGEKYGDVVRVIQVGDFSTELCGGTHVDRSSDIALFKIVSETGIAAGVRRIIAYTSETAFKYLHDQETRMKSLRNKLKASSLEDVELRVDRLLQQEKDLRKQVQTLQSKQAGSEIDVLLQNAIVLKKGRLVVKLVETQPDGVKILREMGETIKQKAPDALVVLGMDQPESSKALLLSVVGPKAPQNLGADQIIREISPVISGRGGGKKDMAQAGGTDRDKLSLALEKARSWIQTQVSGD